LCDLDHLLGGHRRRDHKRLGRAVHARHVAVQVGGDTLEPARTVEDGSAEPAAVVGRTHHRHVAVVPAAFEPGADVLAGRHFGSSLGSRRRVGGMMVNIAGGDNPRAAAGTFAGSLPGRGVLSPAAGAARLPGRLRIVGMGAFGIGTVLVVGGTGRLGALLRLAWTRAGQGGLVWQGRRPGAGGPVFDPLTEPRSYAAAARGTTAILSLAGRVGGDAVELANHAALGVAALRAAAEAGVPHVFLASSAAVYGGSDGAREEDEPSPVSDYGRGKLAMEEAARTWVAARPAGPGVTCLRIAN